MTVRRICLEGERSMSRTFRYFTVVVGALMLSAGACETKTENVVENVSAEDVAYDNAIAIEENVVNANASEDICDDPNVMCHGGPGTTNAQLPANESEKGLGAFNDPPEMTVGNDYELTFVAARDQQGLVEESQGQPLTAPSSIRIAPYMKVTLLPNSNFNVTAKGADEKPIGPDLAATWHWEVRPLRRGSQTLRAQVDVLRVRPDQTIETIDSDTSFVNVMVKVGTWKAFINALRDASDLGEVLSTLFGAWEKALISLIALIGAFWGVVWAIRNRGKSTG
jgi:hypothetical protein